MNTLLLLLHIFLPQDTSFLLLADPTIFKHNGTYYAYGTNGANANAGIPVFTSKDMVNWVDKGFALHRGDAFGTQGFWAPQVFQYRKKFYMAYTANESIAIAVSDNPAGPFRQTMKQSLPSDLKQIDPFVLFDEGKIYLYHVRLDSGNRIFVAQLKDDLSATVPGTLKECIHAEGGWENTANASWPVSEGPTVLKRNGKYYLFYSCNDFRNIDYAVGVAVSDHPTGPFRRLPRQPVISRHNTGANGSGHGDVLQAGKKWYYVFHTHNSAQKVGPRKTVLMEMTWKNGQPVMVPGSLQWMVRTNDNVSSAKR